jgi:hypothetical protein
MVTLVLLVISLVLGSMAMSAPITVRVTLLLLNVAVNLGGQAPLATSTAAAILISVFVILLAVIKLLVNLLRLATNAFAKATSLVFAQTAKMELKENSVSFLVRTEKQLEDPANVIHTGRLPHALFAVRLTQQLDKSAQVTELVIGALKKLVFALAQNSGTAQLAMCLVPLDIVNRISV